MQSVYVCTTASCFGPCLDDEDVCLIFVAEINSVLNELLDVHISKFVLQLLVFHKNTKLTISLHPLTTYFLKSDEL